ncbi:hypothetical protein P3L10_033308 [Capsicum annuum]
MDSRVRTSSGTFLARGRDKVIRDIEKRIADFTFIPAVMRLVDTFRSWMQGDHVMIMILMTFFDFVAFVLDIQL